MEIKKQTSLRGELTVPGDKSISHRAVMFGSLAQGTTNGIIAYPIHVSQCPCLASADKSWYDERKGGIPMTNQQKFDRLRRLLDEASIYSRAVGKLDFDMQC